MSLPSPPGSSGADTDAGSTPSASSEVAGPVAGPAVKKKSTGEYLESLSTSMMECCLNLKDPTHPLVQNHQSPDFRNKHDALPKVGNKGEHHDNLQKHLMAQPNFHVTVQNTSSEVDESRGRATVYVWYEITGLNAGIEREAIAVFNWERKQGHWMEIKHTGMRGSAGFC